MEILTFNYLSLRITTTTIIIIIGRRGVATKTNKSATEAKWIIVP